jgi:hypothetical protein
MNSPRRHEEHEGSSFPRSGVHRYPHLDVGRNKPVCALSAGLVFPALRLPEKLPLLLTPLTYIHVGNAHLADAGRSYSGLRPSIKLSTSTFRRSGPRPRHLHSDCRVVAPSSRARPAPTTLNLMAVTLLRLATLERCNIRYHAGTW